MGVGGLVDGLVLHQLLQWQHLWPARTPDTTVSGLEENTLADGIFHVTSLGLLLVGLLLLVGRRIELPPLVGYGLIGWGCFNVLDQVVFHVLLESHHIRMVENYQVYGWSFFAFGVALAAVGFLVVRRRGAPGRRQTREE